MSGTPVPKGRPRGRVTQPKSPTAKAFVQFYTPHETVGWEEMVIVQVRQQLTGLMLDHPELARIEMPLHGPAFLFMRFNLPRPKSLPKKVRYPMTSRTDWDNLSKSVQDALQVGGLIKNDCMVIDGAGRKRFAEPGHPVGVEIDLTVLP